MLTRRRSRAAQDSQSASSISLKPASKPLIQELDLSRAVNTKSQAISMHPSPPLSPSSDSAPSWAPQAVFAESPSQDPAVFASAVQPAHRYRPLSPPYDCSPVDASGDVPLEEANSFVHQLADVLSQTPEDKPAPVQAPKSKKKKQPEDHIPRPANAWILYRSEQIRRLKQETTTSKKPQADISKIIGFMWRDESDEVKKFYEEQAVIKKAEHAARYPDYVYCPVRKTRPAASRTVSGSSLSRSGAIATAAAKISASTSPPTSRKRADTAPSHRNTPMAKVLTDSPTYHPLQSPQRVDDIPVSPVSVGLEDGPPVPTDLRLWARMPHALNPHETPFQLDSHKSVFGTETIAPLSISHPQPATEAWALPSWLDSSYNVPSASPFEYGQFLPYSAPPTCQAFSFNVDLDLTSGSTSDSWSQYSVGSPDYTPPTTASSLPSPVYTPFHSAPLSSSEKGFWSTHYDEARDIETSYANQPDEELYHAPTIPINQNFSFSFGSYSPTIA